MTSTKLKGGFRLLLAAAVTASLGLVGGPTFGAGSGSGSGGAGTGTGGDTGSLYSDLVVALRAQDGTPLLREFLVPATEQSPETTAYCVQPASYVPVPGIQPTVNPLDGREVWVIPLQGEWIENPVDPLPVAEITACDPQPQYAMYVSETELERLNLTRTSETVLAQKINDVENKLVGARTVSLDPAGRLTADGVPLDAAPEYAAIYESLMTTGTVPGLRFSDIGYNPWQLAAVAIGAAASKGVPITVDTVEYYNRIVGFTAPGAAVWSAVNLLRSGDPDPTTPMPTNVPPASERFVDYRGFSYNRAATFPGAVTWLDVSTLTWHVDHILDVVPWTNLTGQPIGNRTLTGVTAFAQMADDARAVINYLHEHEVILPGFFMDPVMVDTYAQQVAATTHPALHLTAPATAFRTVPFTVTGSVYNPWGGTTIENARVRITVHAPSALTAGDITATSGGAPVPLSVENGDLVGWWGADTGFRLAPGQRASTDIELQPGATAPLGGYTVTMDLVDTSDPGSVLATDSSVTTMHANELSVMWGGDTPALGTQGTFYKVPVRVYAPAAQDAVLTFTLTGPGDDPSTDLLEELLAKDAKVYASNGTTMVPMPLSLTAQDQLTGTWPTSLGAGFTDLTWYLMVNPGAPVGQYSLDIGVQGGVDLADPAYVSFAAPETHGEQPPGSGEDTTPPVVMITIDSIGPDSASFSFTTSEERTTLETMLSANGVKGPWELATTGTKTYTGLQPGSYVFYVRATDSDGNTATYLKKFVIAAPVPTPLTSPTVTTTPSVQGVPNTRVLRGPRDGAWVLERTARFTLGSDLADASYDVRLNGGAWQQRTGDTITVRGLTPGMNRIRFRARVRGEVDPTPVVRTVYLPVGIAQATRTGAWTMHRQTRSFMNAYLATYRAGQSVSLWAPRVRRLALVVTTSPGAGSVNVYLGSRRLTAQPISLRTRTVDRNHLLLVFRFRETQRGQISIVTAGGGPVRIEGIGIASQ